MRYFKIYSVFFKQYMKSLMEYRIDFLIGMFAFLISQGSGLLFIYIVFENVDALAGFSVEHVLLMYGFSLIPKGIDHLFFDNIWLLPNVVRNGQVDRYLLRPISPLYVFLIERFQPDAFGEIILGTLLIGVSLTRLSTPLSVDQVFALMLFAFLGIFIFTSLKLVTAATAFWLKNSYPLMQVTYNVSDYAKYPVVIFPRVIQFVMTFIIPFALVSYYPVVYLLNEVSFFKVLIYFTIVLSFLGGLGLWVWHKGIHYYESTGS